MNPTTRRTPPDESHSHDAQRKRDGLFRALESVPAFVSVIDSEYNLVFLNSNLKAVVGDLVGQKCYDTKLGSADICIHCPVKNNWDFDKGPSTRRGTDPKGKTWQSTVNRFIDSETGSVAFVLSVLLWSLFPATGKAIPAFARKYGFNCNMCHAGFAKLNGFGQRYRDNGYQIPGQQGGEKTVFDQGPPVALRTSAGWSMYNHDTVTTNSFGLYGLDLLAAGVFHKNVSFLLIYTPRVDEPAADFTGPGNGDNPAQLGGIESANIVFSNIVKDALNVRVGRFEPAYHPFSSKRKYTLFVPYEVYAFTTPSNSFVFDDNQLGIELTGHLAGGFKYGGGIVNGSGANPDNNNAKDFYLNVPQTLRSSLVIATSLHTAHHAAGDLPGPTGPPMLTPHQ